MSFKNGYKIGTMTPRVRELCKLFTGRPDSIQLDPKHYTFVPGYQKYADDYYDFEFFDDDVVLNTFPKTGTTWCQEILWTLMFNSNLDNPAAMTPIINRSPNIEVDWMLEHTPSLIKHVQEHYPDYEQSDGGLALHLAKMTPRPRILKIHLPFSLLGPTINKAKIVYTIRDPRDTCISCYHHCRLFKYENFTGTFDQFVDAFIEGTILWSPYWEHVKEIWEKRKQKNVFITYYEKLKRTPLKEYKKLAKFLGKDLSDDQLNKVIHYTSFEEMKKRDWHVLPAEDRKEYINAEFAEKNGGFFRQGTSGSWKKVLTQEQKEKFEAWIEENCPDREIMANVLEV